MTEQKRGPSMPGLQLVPSYERLLERLETAAARADLTMNAAAADPRPGARDLVERLRRLRELLKAARFEHEALLMQLLNGGGSHA